MGTAEQPIPPLILGGDFGGGGTFLAMGMLAGIMSAAKTGRGQVVDAAMVDGSANLMAYMYGFHRPRTDWPELADKFAAIIATKSRDEWVAHVEGRNACVQPVLDLHEAPQHSHLVARGTFVEHGGVAQPAPAPRFSETPTEVVRQPPEHGEHTAEVLAEFGFTADEIDTLRSRRVITNRENEAPGPTTVPTR